MLDSEIWFKILQTLYCFHLLDSEIWFKIRQNRKWIYKGARDFLRPKWFCIWTMPKTRSGADGAEETKKLLWALKWVSGLSYVSGIVMDYIRQCSRVRSHVRTPDRVKLDCPPGGQVGGGTLRSTSSWRHFMSPVLPGVDGVVVDFLGHSRCPDRSTCFTRSREFQRMAHTFLRSWQSHVRPWQLAIRATFWILSEFSMNSQWILTEFSINSQ